MESADVRGDLEEVLFTEAQIISKVIDLAARIEVDYAGLDLLLVGVLKARRRS